MLLGSGTAGLLLTPFKAFSTGPARIKSGHEDNGRCGVQSLVDIDTSRIAFASHGGCAVNQPTTVWKRLAPKALDDLLSIR